MFSQSTFLHALGELRDLSDGARGVKVAVIDGPVDCSHPSLSSSNIRWLLQQRGVEASGPAIDHGTHIVSIIAGSEMVGGIAPACEILLAPVFHDAGSDSPKISQKDLAHAISWRLKPAPMSSTSVPGD